MLCIYCPYEHELLGKEANECRTLPRRRDRRLCMEALVPTQTRRRPCRLTPWAGNRSRAGRADPGRPPETKTERRCQKAWACSISESRFTVSKRIPVTISVSLKPHMSRVIANDLSKLERRQTNSSIPESRRCLCG